MLCIYGGFLWACGFYRVTGTWPIISFFPLADLFPFLRHRVVCCWRRFGPTLTQQGMVSLSPCHARIMHNVLVTESSSFQPKGEGSIHIGGNCTDTEDTNSIHLSTDLGSGNIYKTNKDGSLRHPFSRFYPQHKHSISFSSSFPYLSPCWLFKEYFYALILSFS